MVRLEDRYVQTQQIDVPLPDTLHFPQPRVLCYDQSTNMYKQMVMVGEDNFYLPVDYVAAFMKNDPKEKVDNFLEKTDCSISQDDMMHIKSLGRTVDMDKVPESTLRAAAQLQLNGSLFNVAGMLSTYFDPINDHMPMLTSTLGQNQITIQILARLKSNTDAMVVVDARIYQYQTHFTHAAGFDFYTVTREWVPSFDMYRQGHRNPHTVDYPAPGIRFMDMNGNPPQVVNETRAFERTILHRLNETSDRLVGPRAIGNDSTPTWEQTPIVEALLQMVIRRARVYAGTTLGW